jgi:hypothetical protein
LHAQGDALTSYEHVYRSREKGGWATDVAPFYAEVPDSAPPLRLGNFRSAFEAAEALRQHMALPDAPTMRRPSAGAMVAENSSLLGADRRHQWVGGTRPLTRLADPVATLLDALCDPRHRTTGNRLFIDNMVFAGYDDFKEVHGRFNAAQQAANTTTIGVSTRLPALRIPGLRRVLDALQAQVEAVHGACPARVEPSISWPRTRRL